MNKAKKNGSAHEPLMKKELPIYSSLKFIFPLRINTRTRHWTFREYLSKPGIYIVWDRGEERVTKVSKVSCCLYKAAIRYLEKRIEKNATHKIAFLLPPEKANLKDWLDKTAKELKIELLKIPRVNSFKKLKPYLKQGNKEKILSLLDFKPPFSGELTEDGRRIRTFKDGFMGRGGCYVVLKDDKVDLTGKSDKQLADRMYRHFYPTYGHPSVVVYSDELKDHDFKVALIEIPSLGKSYEEFKKEVKELEKFLILELDPPANKIGRNNDTAVHSDLEDWMVPTPDEQLPF